MRRQGFTLIELLVVVAIIALLIAILLPSLARAREQARGVVCGSSLGQIAKAWHAYLDEHKGAFLRGVNMEYNYGGLQGEGSVFFGKDPARPVPKPLNRYLGLPLVKRDRADVFVCPSDRGTRFVRPRAIRYYGTSYYPNHILIGQSAVWVPPGARGRDIWNDVIRQMNTLTRSNVSGDWLVILIGDFTWLDNWDESVPKEFPCWHGRRSMHNLAFLDGHVAFTKIRKGIHVDPNYTLIPCRDLRSRFVDAQQEIAPP